METLVIDDNPGRTDAQEMKTELMSSLGLDSRFAPNTVSAIRKGALCQPLLLV